MKFRRPLLPRAILIAATLVLLPLQVFAAEPPHLKVGVVIPLSGPFAEFGAAVRNGIELARAKEPEKFTAIEFLYEDDQYTPKTALTAVQKLRSVDHADIIFGWGNESALAIAPVAERQRFPFIAVAQHPKVGVGYRFVIRFINPIEDFSSVIADYLLSAGLKEISLLQSEISFFDALVDTLRARLAGQVKLDELEKVMVTDYDFKVQIAKLKGKKIDALGLYLTAPQIVQFYKQAAELGLKFKGFGATTFESKSVLGPALPLMDGAVYSHLNAEPAFLAEYRAKFGNDAQISYAANAFDFATAVSRIAPEIGVPAQADAVLGAFRRLPPAHGAAGSYEFRESPDSGQYFRFDLKLKVIRNGEMIELLPEPAAPALVIER